MKKHALLVGVNQYHLLGNLAYARQDAEAVADALCRHCGFSDQDITLMTCQSEGACLGLSRYIEHALMNLTNERDLDMLVFGFWGHGFAPQAGRRYLCGMDTAENDLERTAVSFDVVKARLAQIGAENTLLLLDCCQNQPIGRSTSAAPMTQGEEMALASMARDIQTATRDQGKTTMPTVAILNACREGQRAYEWDSRGHGVFTAHLLDAFDQGFTSVAPMSAWLFDRVTKTSRELHQQDQTPYVTIEGKGDISLPLITISSSELRAERPISHEMRQTRQQPKEPQKGEDDETLRQKIERDFQEAKRAIVNSAGSREYIEKVWSASLSDWQKGADKGWPEALWLVGRCSEEGFGQKKDPGGAVQLYSKAAEQGNAIAQHTLGICYTYGDGVQKDETLATQWYRKAAEQGYALAQVWLGSCYANGKGVPKDQAKALDWYRKAAEQGHAEAQTKVGVAYDYGKGVSEDQAEAVKWYRKAADQGYPNAQFLLGCAYYFGKGVSENPREAAKWYFKAAEQGIAAAQFSLGSAYEDGNGVGKDKSEAVNWYRKASEQGYEPAKEALRKMGQAVLPTSSPKPGSTRANSGYSDTDRDSSMTRFTSKLVKGTGVLAFLGGTREYDKNLNEIAKLVASKVKQGRVEIPDGDFGDSQSIARSCIGSLVRAMQKRGFTVVSDCGEVVLEIYSLIKYQDAMAKMMEEANGEPPIDAFLFEERGYRMRVTVSSTGERLWEGAIRVPKNEL
jgi:TPR repeat protein